MLAQAPIRRRRLCDEVTARIEAMIRRGELKEGDQLPSERDLMEAFQVGRPSVREALFALKKMGLVALNAGERARVVKPTPDALLSEVSGMARYILAQPEGMQQFQDARGFFEVGLARYAARHATDEDVARLDAALAAHEKALDDLVEAVRTDVAFHAVLAEIPGNQLFRALHAALAEWLIEQPTTALHVAGAIRAAYEEHRQIYEAIAARDPDAAERAMEHHMREAARYYWEARGAPGPFAADRRRGG